MGLVGVIDEGLQNCNIDHEMAYVSSVSISKRPTEARGSAWLATRLIFDIKRSASQLEPELEL